MGKEKHLLLGVNKIDRCGENNRRRLRDVVRYRYDGAEIASVRHQTIAEYRSESATDKAVSKTT